MRALTLVLGDQLYEHHTCLDDNSEVLMIESVSFTKQYTFHAFRLAYQFTLMREYADYLRSKGKQVHYIHLSEKKELQDVLSEFAQKFTTLKVMDIHDKQFKQDLQVIASKFERFELIDEGRSPSFLTSAPLFQNYIGAKKKHLLMYNFYIWQRKRLKILLDEQGGPEGGAWSYDALNRKRLPKDIEPPAINRHYTSKYYHQVVQEVRSVHPHYPGNVAALWLPVTHQQAREHLQAFLEHRFSFFGPYEDAMTTRSDVVFHSVLSPLLNHGLLLPSQVVEIVIEYATKNESIPLQSVEGFIRQVIGWREWIKGLADTVYESKQYNFFHHTKPLPSYFWTYDLREIEDNIPLCHTLMTVKKLAWCHHIPRLMILGNWMLLNRYHPEECFAWFRSQFVDAFDWVMIPNVYGMALYADGGIFATKPYLAGGNYIKKMSDYPHSEKWEKTWTTLYWNFVHDNNNLFRGNPRMRTILKGR